MVSSTRRSALLTLGCLLAPIASHAQFGSVIRRQIDKQTDKKVEEATAQPPKFDNETLELTGERLDKLIRGKEAARAIAAGPNGPEALRTKLSQLEEQRNKLAEKLGDKVEMWEQRKMEAESCVRDSLQERTDRKRAALEQGFQMTDPVMRQRLTELSLKLAQAQQKGDAREVDRLTKEFQAMGAPTAKDSAEVKRVCGDPVPPPGVAELRSLDQAVEELKLQITKAEKLVSDTETRESGMNQRQLAIACERIKEALQRLKKKMAEVGMTPVEWQALKERAEKLEALCG